MSDKVFKSVEEFAQLIREQGEKLPHWEGRAKAEVAYVGGKNRDEEMGNKPKDQDLAVQGFSKEEFESMFEWAVPTGAKYPVYYVKFEESDGTIDSKEVALLRTEVKTGVGRNGNDYNSDPTITFDDDAARRDFDINSMYKIVGTEEVKDPYGGKVSIQQKVIRAIFTPVKEELQREIQTQFSKEELLNGVIHPENKAYFLMKDDVLLRSNLTEDALRMLRGFRFAARYGFTIDEDTFHMFFRMGKELEEISNERVVEEIMKTFKEAKSGDFPDAIPSKFFRYFKRSGTMGFKMIELAEMSPTKFEETMKAVDVMKFKTEEEAFAVLTHQMDEKQIRKMGLRLKFPTDFISIATFISKNLDLIQRIDSASSEEVVEFIEELKKHPMTKQSESYDEVDTAKWFFDAIDTLFEAIGKSIDFSNFKKVYQVVSDYKPEIPEEYEDKEKRREIGSYIRQKKVEFFNNLLSI